VAAEEIGVEGAEDVALRGVRRVGLAIVFEVSDQVSASPTRRSSMKELGVLVPFYRGPDRETLSPVGEFF